MLRRMLIATMVSATLLAGLLAAAPTFGGGSLRVILEISSRVSRTLWSKTCRGLVATDR